MRFIQKRSESTCLTCWDSWPFKYLSESISTTRTVLQSPGSARRIDCRTVRSLCLHRRSNRRPYRRHQLRSSCGVRFLAHIEHLKPQSVCRLELIARGLRPSFDLGEDMDYRNMVAAILVQGARVEQFGAAARGDRQIPIWPTHRNCETKFRFHRDGSVDGIDVDGVATVAELKLNHETLPRLETSSD